MIVWKDGVFPAARRPVRGHWVIVDGIEYMIVPGPPFDSGDYVLRMACQRCGTEWVGRLGRGIPSLTRARSIGLVEATVSRTVLCEDAVRRALAAEIMGT